MIAKEFRKFCSAWLSFTDDNFLNSEAVSLPRNESFFSLDEFLSNMHLNETSQVHSVHPFLQLLQRSSDNFGEMACRFPFHSHPFLHSHPQYI